MSGFFCISYWCLPTLYLKPDKETPKNDLGLLAFNLQQHFVSFFRIIALTDNHRYKNHPKFGAMVLK